MRNLEELFIKINIKPHDASVYELALTHPSFNADANTRHSDYERFEYMGDAVLDYVAADLIFKSFPDMEPGRMSKLRSYLVKTHSLSNYARNIELFNYIKPYRKKMIQQLNKISEEENPIKLMKYNEELNKTFEMEPYKTIYEQSLYGNEKPKTK